MGETVIAVEGLTKAYRIWATPAKRLLSPMQAQLAKMAPGTLASRLRRRAAAGYRDFFALHDVNFTVGRGEAVGIVGRNGSGKSTLLQIIAGTLQPTAGRVRVEGRIAALLELGSGFNPEFTGRENVFLNGAVLGLTRREVDRKFDSIAAFADIGDFLDQPVKTYSSGMTMRLAFAVQSSVDPDILIVDEALSVGDAPFQAKCFARIREIQSRGSSILLVSHDVGTVRTFCQRALWLKGGAAQASGDATEVCDAYNRDCLRAMGMVFEEANGNAAPAELKQPAAGSHWLAEDRSDFAKLAATDRHGGGPLQLRNFFFLDARGERSSLLQWDEKLTAVFVIGTDTGHDGLFQVGMVCKTLQGQELLTCSDRTHGKRIYLAPGEERVVTLHVTLPLRAGKYVITTGVFLFPDDARFPTGTYDFTRSTVSDFVTHTAVIEIAPQFNLGIYGPVQQEAHLTMEAS